jgi:AcrR family transcriptional regulator
LSGTVLKVVGEVKSRKRRRYHSPLRADQARRTRSRILETAYGLFVEGGYARTTIAAVAAGAGVSTETIYQAFRDKRGLLEGVVENAIAPETDVAAQEDEWRARIAELKDAADRLALMVEYSCGILVRTRPIHAVIRGAADKEPFAVELGRRLLQERLANQTGRIAEGLDGELKEGLSVTEAGQRYCALTAPELYHVLTVELGWTADQHRIWLTELLRTELLRG